MIRTLHATGLSGTIGQHLRNRCEPLRVRLDGEIPRVLDVPQGAVVLHLAAVVGETKVRNDLQKSRIVNVDGAVELARAVKRSSARQFIYVSTSHVYEIPDDGAYLSENAAKLPRGHYALQKLLAEELIQEVFSAEPDRLVIARVFSVLDRHQPAGTLGHSILRLASDITSQLTCADDERDFLSPKIIADVLAQLSNLDENVGVINVCSGRSLTVREVAKLLLSKDEFACAANRILPGRSTSPRIVGDSSKLERALGLKSGSLLDKFQRELE